MLKTKLALSLSIAIVAAGLAAAPAGAKSSSSSHSSSSHSSSSSHKSSAGHAGPAATTTRKPLPSGTHFVQKTCKTSSCKAKHPSGSYMLPVKPKKGSAGAA